MCTRRFKRPSSDFDRCMAEGGATRKAMDCLCLRLFRRQDKDGFLVSSHTSIPVPQPGDKEWWASSIVRRADSNFSTLAVFGPVYLVAGVRSGILTWLPPSPWMRRLSFRPTTWAAWRSWWSGRLWLPGGNLLPWLLSAGLRPGDPKVYLAIASLLLREGECIPRSILVIREKTYQLFPTSFCPYRGALPRLHCLRPLQHP
jgi:hypothetical protein